MNVEDTKEKIRLMKLYGMIRAYDNLLDTRHEQDLSVDEALSFLVDAEWEERYNRKLFRLLKAAKFRYTASFSEIDFQKPRNINKGNMMRFANSDWIKKAESIIITGATGLGKSFLSCAFGHQACINGYRVLYFNCLKLFPFLLQAKGDGTYTREMKKIKNQDLIILDDFGLHVLDGYSRLILLEIFEDRHGIKSTVITSQLPPNKWHEVIGNATVADAICDRIVHSSHKINMEGDSMRKINQ